MKRYVDTKLLQWRDSSNRKVLLVRGARQVGKTYSVRVLGQTFENYVEVNFEEHPEVGSFFDGSLSPEGILEKLKAYFGVSIYPKKTLLFFDEVQACPNCLKALRFFYEKVPLLHVAAAGSLLEFSISEIPSFGVGRISSLFMYPLSFREFLWAIGFETLAKHIEESNKRKSIGPVLHKKALEHLRTYCAIGGMPDVVDHYRISHDIRESQTIIDDIISGLRDDFSKYSKSASVHLLDEVFDSIALQTGRKFKYRNINPDLSHYELKKAFELLIKAGLAYRVFHSDSRGIPLGAQINPRRFKALLFDIGITQRLVHLDLPSYLVQSSVELITKGSVAEQFCGLELIANTPPHQRAQLFYWHREARNSNAEVDFVIQQNNKIVPIEIKAGVRGAMQSMYLFLNERQLEHGFRLSHENYSTYGVIETAPLYTAGNLIQSH